MSRMGGIDLTQGWRGPITELNRFEDEQGQQITQTHDLQMRLAAAQTLRNTAGMNPQPDGQANQLQQAYAQGQQRRQGRSMTSEGQAGMGPSPMEKAVATAKMMQQEPPEPQEGTMSIAGGGHNMSETIPAEQNQPDVAAAHNAWENSPKQVQARQSQQRFSATQQRQQQTADVIAKKESGDEDIARQQNDEAVQGLLAMKTVPSAVLNGNYPTGMDSDEDKKKALGLAKQYKKSLDFLQKRQAEKTVSAGDQSPYDQQPPQGWQHPATGQQYQEGMVLRSPSTGKAYKIINGQPQEITNGGQ